jgi:hypothetical protein
MQNFFVVRRILQMRTRGESETQNERENQKLCDCPVRFHFERPTELQAALILIKFLDHSHEIGRLLTQEILIGSGEDKQNLESGTVLDGIWNDFDELFEWSDDKRVADGEMSSLA